MSRVPSRSTAPRTPLAMRDWNFLKPVALRPTRWPATRPMRGAPAASAASSAGMKAGSFWPSPSSVTTTRRARCRTPVRTAADCPHEDCMLDLPQPRPARHQLRQLGFGAVGRAVVDVDDLEARCRRRARPRSRRPAARYCRPRCAPERRRTRRAAPRWQIRRSCSSDLAARRLASGRGASFLWGDQLPGNPFDAAPTTGPATAARSPSAPITKASRARREPVAHQQRADHADDGAGDHVARKVRGEHDPAHRDEDGIGPQQRPRPRPQRADRDRGREGIVAWPDGRLAYSTLQPSGR